MTARVLMMEPAGATGLAAALGSERATAVSELLRARALDWAREACDVDPRTAVRGESLAQSVGRALAGLSDGGGAVCGGGVLLVVWPDLPVWRTEHWTSALADLDDGCGVAVGPVFDGGFYLVALAASTPGMLDLTDGADAMNRAFAAAHAAGVEVGLLRPERGLRSETDIAAALADPMLDDELRGLLG